MFVVRSCFFVLSCMLVSAAAVAGPVRKCADGSLSDTCRVVLGGGPSGVGSSGLAANQTRGKNGIVYGPTMAAPRPQRPPPFVGRPTKVLPGARDAELEMIRRGRK